MKHIIYLFLLLSSFAFSQVGIGTTSPHSSATLDVSSSSRGFLVPRMTTTQRDLIINPAEGLIIYNFTSKCLQINIGSESVPNWTCLYSAQSILSTNCVASSLDGVYKQSVALTSLNQFKVKLENTGTATSGAINLATSDLSLSGIGGVSVASVTPSVIDIPAGSSEVVTYQLSGNPTSTGILTATWSKTGFSDCIKTTNILHSGDATFTLPSKSKVFSMYDAVNSIDIQGVVDNNVNKITIDLPYTAGSGSYGAFVGDFVLNNAGTGESGDNNKFRLTYPTGVFSPTGVITATIEVDGDGLFNAKKQLNGLNQNIALLDFQINGASKGNIELDVVGGIPDRNYLTDSEHKFIYTSIVAKDGKIWLNNNLGADYSNFNHVLFKPLQQGTGSTNDLKAKDKHAFGSYYQWGRLSDGHELVNRNISPSEGVYGKTTTTSDTDIPGDNLFIYDVYGGQMDWRTTVNDNLWQGDAGINNPCPVGYRLPTKTEMDALFLAESITLRGNAASSTLVLTAPGYRSAYNNSVISGEGGDGIYWTSSVNSGANKVKTRFVRSFTADAVEHQKRYGASVRCIKGSSVLGTPVLSTNCGITSLDGAYTHNSALTTSHKFTVTLENTGGGNSAQSFNVSDVNLTGVNGMTVSGVSPSSATIAAGGNQVVTYQLSGTPTDAGTLTATFSKTGFDDCVKTKTVNGTAILAITSTGNDLTGSYIHNSVSNGAFNIQIENTGSIAGTVNIQPADISFSGVGGMAVTGLISSGGITSIPPGIAITEAYQIAGTPTNAGTLTAVWSNAAVPGTYTRTKSVGTASILSTNCGVSSLDGSYTQNSVLTNSHRFRVRLENTGSASSAITLNTSDLVLSGVNGMTVSSVSPSNANIAPGGNQVVTYQLSGTPTGSGTLTATFSKSGFNNCVKTKIVATPSGSATFSLPSSKPIVSTVISGSADVQGVINNTTKKIVFSLPYTSGSGAYSGFTGNYIALTGQGGDANSLRISYPSGTFSSTGSIDVTVEVNGDQSFNVSKLTPGGASNIATFDFKVNGISQGDLIIKALGGILDLNFYADLAGRHRFIYVPVIASDGRTWLNNNLGANYAKVGHSSFRPEQDATSSTDNNASGSLFQWGRKADNHELIYRTTSGSAPLFGNTTTRTDNPSNPNFINASGSATRDWRQNSNSLLWSTVSSSNNPCPTGYRLPSVLEWETLVNLEDLPSNHFTASCNLVFPNTGRRQNTGTVSATSTASYWSSNANSNGPHQNADIIVINSSSVNYNNANRYFGYAVRCIKN